MGYSVKLSQTARPLLFKLRLASDHVTGATGKTPTVTLSKNGGAFAACAGAVTEIANGWYKVAANATDTGTLGPLLLHATAASCDETDEAFEVVAYDPDAAAGLGLTNLDAAVSTVPGSVLAAAAAAPVAADVKKVNAVTVTGTGATGDEWGPA